MSNLIEVQGVSKSYGGLNALSLCDLQVREGEINGLIGPNGSGKTTLFNVVTGYERIQQGTVSFRGTDITNAPPDRVFKLGIGRTFQLTRMFPRLTVLENMLVATQRQESWLRGVLRLAGSASEKRRALELLDFVGIARLAHEPGGNLSYGQRKLLELASMLVADPAILLLDEPAGGVNPTLIGHLGDRIRDLNRDGKTILVVEHNMEFVMSLCSRITVLREGTALISGTPEEVRSDPAVLDAYLGGEDDASTQQRARRRGRPCPGAVGHSGAAGAREARRVHEPAHPPRRHRRLRRRRHPQGRHPRRPARQHHLRRRTQRRGQVDADGDDQRPAPSPPRRDHLRRPRHLGIDAEADPHPRAVADPAGPQPVRRHDGARERRDGRLHGRRPRARAQAPGGGGGALPDRLRARRREGRGPLRRPAAAGGVRPLPDARPEPDHARRALDGTRPPDPADGLRDDPADEPAGQDDPAGRAERPRRPEAEHVRGRPRERRGPPHRLGPRGPRAPRDRRAVPRRRGHAPRRRRECAARSGRRT